MFKKVLVPLDGSRFSSRSIGYASEIARRFDAKLTFIQVIPPTTPVPTTTGTPPGVESPAAAEISMQTALLEDKKNVTGAKRYLSRKVRDIRTEGIKASYNVIVGDPSNSIMLFSNKEKIDLIVMTTHGKSGLKRAIMGSVADTVIRESGKPVLVIRTKKNK
jgi:nucleotide-binding universal stress UspA family protein